MVVDVDLSPIGGDSLFAVAPYFYDASGSDIVHWPDRWLISRRNGPFFRRGSEISYRFLSRGFAEGNLPKFTPRFPIEDQLDSQHQALLSGAKDERGILNPETALKLVDQRMAEIDNELDAIEFGSDSESTEGSANRNPTRYRLEQERDRLRQWHTHEQASIAYSQACLEYDIDRVPSASLLAKSIIDASKAIRMIRFVLPEPSKVTYRQASDLPTRSIFLVKRCQGLIPSNSFCRWIAKVTANTLLQPWY